MSDPSASLLSKIAEYEEQLARNPASKAFVPLSEAYRRMGMLDEALVAIQKGKGIHPGFVEADLCEARILAQRGDHVASLRLFDGVLSAQPENLPALKGLARVHLLLDQPKEAYGVIRKLQQLAPGDGDVEKLRAQCQSKLSSTMKESAQTAETPIKTATLADIYVKQGLFGEAVKVYEQILQTSPGNEEVRRKLETLRQRMQVESPAAATPQTTAASRQPVAQADVPESKPVGPDAVIPVFESWLKAIRQRREHVR